MTSLKDTQQLPSQGTLHHVNLTFHERYAKRKHVFREQILGGEYQLVIRMDDRIIAQCGKEVDEHEVVGPHYHDIKAAAHLPLLLMYADNYGEILDFIRAHKDEAHMSVIRELFCVVEEWAVNPQHNEFIDLTTLKSTLAPLFARAMDTVAKEEIEKTVAVLNKINSQASLPLDKTFFIIFGSHQARYKQLGKMIIKKWFTQQTECYGKVEHHVRYCEGGKNIDDALDIVCTALADNELAHVFLGEQFALNQDVVTQTAERHLSQFWPTDD
ncbi:hypothetical protein OPS25_13720 [Alteromonas ponticola]|uniref:Uncharacterized protein n=1 Tax=Alteromonas aquimaris TaxID=2998417 RepID=A0ABT3P9V7_9ALTE|nr:hypothetical protein [Alteromonas aquimaris]MCW8109562.1 hypothetical protein [Alteromonas aquimaris]